MKTIIKLLCCLIIAVSFFAETNAQSFVLSPSQAPAPSKIQNIQKAAGDTLYYEDFSDSTLSNWTLVDSTNLGHDWIWSTSAPGGQYSINMPALNSTSKLNGFISLRGDFYNTPMSPIGPDTIRAYITSGPIPINPAPNVELIFQQFERDCCFGFGRPEIGLSVDGINWTNLSATNGRFQNTPSSNPEFISHDVSFLFANEDTVYLRFFQRGNSHYFWMLDDVLLREGITTSVLENSIKSKIEIYPIPSKGLINIVGEVDGKDLLVRDIKGRLVHSQNLQKDESSLDLSFLKNGLYFLHFKGEEEVKKLLIQK